MVRRRRRASLPTTLKKNHVQMTKSFILRLELFKRRIYSLFFQHFLVPIRLMEHTELVDLSCLLFPLIVATSLSARKLGQGRREVPTCFQVLMETLRKENLGSQIKDSCAEEMGQSNEGSC